MSNESKIVPLTFPGSGEKVRVVWLDDHPHWVVNDVCRELGIESTRTAAARLFDGYVRTTNVTDSLGRSPKTNVVNEPGLYQLVFMSRKPKAEAFRRWIFEEVIPAIRQTGAYESAEALQKRVMDLAEKMDPSYRKIDKAWREGKIPSDVIRAFAHNHGLLTEAVGFPVVMTTSGEIDDENGVGKNRTARLNNGRTRSKMYEGKTGRKPFKAVTWRADEFRIVNQFPREHARSIEGFRDVQPKALDK
jgi:prophage antirepressor-like protein